MFVEDLFTFLSNAGTDAGSRVYPQQLGQGEVLPAIRYFRVSDPREHTQDGPSKLHHPRFQLDCYAETYLAAVRLAIQVEDRLDGYVGMMGSSTVEASFVEDAARDDYDPETGRHSVSVDVTIWHKE